MKRLDNNGYTLVELLVGVTIFSIVSLSLFGLFTALINSNLIAKRQAVALSIATSEIEYLRSLPYDNLAIQGGSIISANPLPASKTESKNGEQYQIITSINYIDGAFDGCTNYPNQELKELYCRNYPPPQNAPAVDANPQDYKGVNVKILGAGNVKLAELDTHVAARVSETASTTGALFVSTIDGNGDPVAGATVRATNNTSNPAIDVSDTTDSNGIAVFYGLPPDTVGFDYTITASKQNYSSLTTIKPVGQLQPTYSSQNILSQQPSYTTLVLKPMNPNSIVVEATNSSGTPIANLKFSAKGGYKKYVEDANTEYYFDNFNPDTRPTTNSSGVATLQDLVPGEYTFCGDNGDQGCFVGGTQYFLAAAVPFTGPNSFSPTVVPQDIPTQPPAQKFSYNGQDYTQRVRLILSPSASFPRIKRLQPFEASISGGTVSSFTFTINGTNLPCSDNPASCLTDVDFLQGTSVFNASCTGSSAGNELSCAVNLSGATIGSSKLRVSVGGSVLTIQTTLPLGGINVLQ